eukprot:m.351696 g.351696  ORF g.351696 m.351696 type:complete len:278 (+) comp16319_c0_seq1:266-1099(+)
MATTVPPKFSDFGKNASDLFSKNFGAGSSKFVANAKPSEGPIKTVKVEFKRDTDSGAVSGFIESTSKFGGFDLKEKWNTKNLIETEVSRKCPIIPNAKHTVCASFNPAAGGFSGFSNLKLKTAAPCKTANTNLTLTDKTVTADSSFTFKGFNLGGSATVSIADTKLTSSKVGVGFKVGDTDVATSIANGDAVETSMFQKLSKLNSAVRFGWTKSTGKTFIELGFQQKIADGSFAKIKVNDKLDIGVSYQTQLNPEFSATFKVDFGASSKVGVDVLAW